MFARQAYPTMTCTLMALVWVAGPLLSAAKDASGPVLYAPDVVMVGRRFMVALEVAPNAPAVRVTAPESVELYDRTKLATKSHQRRYYFRATAADLAAQIRFGLSGGEASVSVQILTFEQLLQPRRS